jgi:hypothetical protein
VQFLSGSENKAIPLPGSQAAWIGVLVLGHPTKTIERTVWADRTTASLDAGLARNLTVAPQFEPADSPVRPQSPNEV